MSECKLPENEQERKNQHIDSTIERINGYLEMMRDDIKFLNILGVKAGIDLPNSIAIQPTSSPVQITWINTEE